MESAPELVRLVTRDFMQDPYPALREAREEGEAVPIDSSGMRMWVVTRYEDARRLLADPDICKDMVANGEAILRSSVVRPEKLRGVPLALRRHMLDRDEPDHTRLRSIVSGHFTGSTVESMRAEIAATAGALLDGLPAEQPVDLIERFCRPLARTVISKLIGIPPDDPAPFPEWVNDLLTAPDRSILKASAESLVEFIGALVDGKADKPGPDIATALSEAVLAKKLTRNEAVASVHVLLTGGMEPLNGIANAVHSLLRHPEQLTLLTDDLSRIPNCVEETLRYESPFRMLTPRYSRVPVRVGSTTIPANEMILISVAAAGRDPHRFDDPDTFDIERNAGGHLGFGRGIHRCLGAHLGRLEVETGLSLLLSRRPGLRPAEEADTPVWQPGIFMRRLHRLPVVLGGERPAAPESP
ncbi:cytochrome P450 [Streptomyces sp. NPDC048277]|uniref:cytochrome P450 family protein n=1 Tax=Streptomyces sp. NPDC048277 TaxID=3155027 RepID=UPI00340B2BF8